MKVIGLISGGKDSCFNMMQCIAAGHKIVALANLIPKTRTEIDSYMYQSVGYEAIDLIAKSLQLPLYRYETAGKSFERELNYQPTDNDEVEDLFMLLKKAKEETDIEGVSVGAILSDYQRIRVENVCSRLGLVSLAYLWQRDQTELLEQMIKCEVDAVIIKVAALGLEPKRHLGRSLRLIQPHLHAMHEKYGLNVCGEGGEYETLVLDCPLFTSRIIIEESEIVLHSDDPIAAVGFLKLNKLKLETKLPVLDLKGRMLGIPLKDSDGYITDEGEEACDYSEEDNVDLPKEILTEELIKNSYNFDQTVNSAKSGDGWLWTGGLSGNSEDPRLAVNEALQKLKCSLSANEQTLQNVCSITMFISDMSKFAELNESYLETLNHLNPPSRACVQVPLPKNCPVILEALSWSLPSSATGDLHIDRHTMHVQSISHWAPANIGPYSQAVRIGDLIHLAGQIGLVPGSVQLVKGGVKSQCHLALRHVGRVLKAMDPNVTLRDVVQGICYVTNIRFIENARKVWESKTNNAIVDYVVVSGLPRNALVEWHVWAHRHNSQFDYEETVKCIEDWSISIYRRWNFENNIAAIVCHLDNSKEPASSVPVTVFDETIRYTLEKLQKGHETDKSIYSLKIFYSVTKSIPIRNFIATIDQNRTTLPFVYTVVPVTALNTDHCFVSICGVRYQ